jgi:MFS family permease
MLEKMTALERRSVSSLAAIMSLRLLGLFMILPVFALYAKNLAGATPFLIGLTMGIYGLTQGLLQIPFGMVSDNLGRKPVITFGLLLFAAGSILAAVSHSIHSMLIARALQGAGAIGSTTIAMIADLTREEQRTKAMAMNGMTIGVSFSLAMILGPLFSAWIHVSGIFWLATGFSILAIIILYTLVPTPDHTAWHSDSEPERAQFWNIVKDGQLSRLNAGVFLLHAIFTASFVVIPISLEKYAGLAGPEQWMVYVPSLLLAFFVSIFFIVLAEKKQQIKKSFILAIIFLGLAELSLSIWALSPLMSGLGLLIFFTGFSILEANLPSWISRAAPKSRKGTALGIYSCSQFLGIFVGGSVGGWLYGLCGLREVYLLCVFLALVWLAIAYGMQNPQYTPRPK